MYYAPTVYQDCLLALPQAWGVVVISLYPLLHPVTKGHLPHVTYREIESKRV